MCWDCISSLSPGLELGDQTWTKGRKAEGEKSMDETKAEHWWVVRCKSPGCDGGILLEKIGDAEPYKHPLAALPPDDPCVDWSETCRACDKSHTYSKGDVTSKTGRPEPGPGSLAFRKARARKRRVEGRITRDGFTFDSDWIDSKIADFKDLNVPWAVRRSGLDREIAMREEDLISMLQTMPSDRRGHAHSRAYLDALRLTEEELHAEISRST